MQVRDGNGTITTLSSTATPIAAGTGSVQGVAATTNLTLVGYKILETAHGVASVKIHHGTDNTGPLLDVPLNLAPNELRREWFGPTGPSCPNGIFIERISGTTQIELYTLPT